MPKQVRITIKKKSEGASPVFDPDPAKADLGDQIFWSNKDTKAHWPGRLVKEGTTEKIDKTFFIPHKVAGNGDVSSSWGAAIANRTYEYACSLHPDDPDERGTIVVRDQEEDVHAKELHRVSIAGDGSGPVLAGCREAVPAPSPPPHDARDREP